MDWNRFKQRSKRTKTWFKTALKWLQTSIEGSVLQQYTQTKGEIWKGGKLPINGRRRLTFQVYCGPFVKDKHDSFFLCDEGSRSKRYKTSFSVQRQFINFLFFYFYLYTAHAVHYVYFTPMDICFACELDVMFPVLTQRARQPELNWIEFWIPIWKISLYFIVAKKYGMHYLPI